MPLIPGQVVGRPTTATPYPNVEREVPFVLMANPKRYEVAEIDGEPFLLPTLLRFRIGVGHNGIAPRPGETFDLARDSATAIAKKAKEGERVIDPALPIPEELLPPGVGEGGYRREIDLAPTEDGHPRTSFIEAWNVITIRNGETIEKFDRARYNLWRLWLVTEGLVPEPDQSVIERLQHHTKLMVQQRKVMPGLDPEVKRDTIADAQRRADAVDKAAANLAERL